MSIVGKNRALALLISVALLAQLQPAVASDSISSQIIAGIPAGRYVLDKSHSTLLFKVSHLGFSYYTASFSRFDAALDFDPNHLEKSKLAATIDVGSLVLPAPPDGFLQELLGPKWLNAKDFPQMTYQSRKITSMGDNNFRVLGDLMLNGKAAPVTFDVTLNGGYAGMTLYDPQARAGFSAHGRLNRSDFGVSLGIPEEGSSMGVGNEVEFIIETEFQGPPLAKSTLEE